MVLLTSRTPERADRFPDFKPDGVAAVRRSGRRPFRILMFGGGVLVGLGIRDHNLGLPGHFADALVDRSERGVDIDVIVDAATTSPRAIWGLRGLRLRRYDAVVVFLGSRPLSVGLSQDAWRRQIELLTRTLHDETSPSTPVVLCDTMQAALAVSPGHASGWRTSARAERVSAIAADVARLTGTIALELSAGVSAGVLGRFSGATYAIWADTIASRVYPKLLELPDSYSAESAAAFRAQPDPESPRLQALAQMRLQTEMGSPMLDLIVQKSKVAFRARDALLNIVDNDMVWSHASSSNEPSTMPRAMAFCDHTIRTDGLTLVNDSHRDARFSANPISHGPDAVRFYAGYPIHSPDGYRIGALCITDGTPRNLRSSELTPLHDFAGRVEQELWATALAELRRPAETRPGSRP